MSEQVQQPQDDALPTQGNATTNDHRPAYILGYLTKEDFAGILGKVARRLYDGGKEGQGKGFDMRRVHASAVPNCGGAYLVCQAIPTGDFKDVNSERARSWLEEASKDALEEVYQEHYKKRYHQKQKVVRNSEPEEDNQDSPPLPEAEVHCAIIESFDKNRPQYYLELLIEEKPGRLAMLAELIARPPNGTTAYNIVGCTLLPAAFTEQKIDLEMEAGRQEVERKATALSDRNDYIGVAWVSMWLEEEAQSGYQSTDNNPPDPKELHKKLKQLRSAIDNAHELAGQEQRFAAWVYAGKSGVSYDEHPSAGATQAQQPKWVPLQVAVDRCRIAPSGGTFRMAEEREVRDHDTPIVYQVGSPSYAMQVKSQRGGSATIVTYSNGSVSVPNEPVSIDKNVYTSIPVNEKPDCLSTLVVAITKLPIERNTLQQNLAGKKTSDKSWEDVFREALDETDHHWIEIDYIAVEPFPVASGSPPNSQPR